LANINKNAVVAVGFEEAYVGFVRRANRSTVALYDYVTCVEILMRDEDFSHKEAVMFMEERILSHETGESSPAFAFWKDEYEDKLKG